MARKKKSKGDTFAVGDRVCVRPGVTDPDWTDIPLGGWVGVVEEPESGGTILIRWTKETLRKMPKVCKIRSERDGLDFELMSLYPSEVERDDGSPLRMEQPTVIVPRPLDLNEQEDRIRAALGVTSRDDDIPRVSYKTLSGYWQYLRERLPFPFLVEMPPEWPLAAEYPGERFLVLRLLPPRKQKVRNGLLCEVRRETHPTRQLSPNERNQSFEVPLSAIGAEIATAQRQFVNDYQHYFSIVGSGDPAT